MTITNATPNTATNMTTGQMAVFNTTQTFASAVTATDEDILFTVYSVFSAGGTYNRCGVAYNLPNDTTNVRNKSCTYTSCKIRFVATAAWNKVALSNLTNCVVTGTGYAYSFPFLSGASAWNNVTLAGTGQIVFDTDAVVSAFNGVSIIDNNGGFWQGCTAGVTARGLVFSGSTPSSMWVSAAAGDSILLDSFTVLTARTRINASSGRIIYKATRQLSSTALAKLAAWDKRTGVQYTQTADASGNFAEVQVECLYPTSWTNGSLGTVVYDNRMGTVGYQEVLYRYGYKLEIRSPVTDYNNLKTGTAAVLNGGTAIRVPSPLTADPYATKTEAQATAMDGATFTRTGLSIAVSANASYEDLFDFLHYRTRVDLPSLVRPAQDSALTIAEYATGSGTTLDIGGHSLVLAPGVTLSAGGKFAKVTMTGTVTGSGTILGLYTDSTGSNARVLWSGLTSATLRILNGSGTQQVYATGISGTRTDYIAPGATGTWSWVALRWGYQKQVGTFTPGSGGDTTAAPVAIPDSRVSYSEVTASGLTGVSFNAGTKTVTVTATHTLTDLIHAWIYWLQGSGQSAVTDSWAWNGSTLDTADWNVVVSAGTLSGTRLNTTGTVTTSGAGVITCSFYAANGNNARVSWSGLSSHYLRILDNAATQTVYASGQTGTRIDYLAAGLTGSYTWVAQKWGYQKQSASFTPGSGGEVTASPVRIPDTRITYTENAASLLTGIAFNAGTKTITVTASVSLADIFHAFAYWLQGSAQYGVSDTWTWDGSILNVFDWNIDTTGGTVTGTRFVTTGTLTGSLATQTYATAAGERVRITVTGLQAGSRVQIRNLTTPALVVDEVVAGTSANWVVPYTTDQTLRLRVAKTGYLRVQATGVLSSSGASFLVSQASNSIYAANAIDGATVTEFTPDFPNIQIDLDDPDGVTSVPRIYAWMCVQETTSQGIETFFGLLDADDAANYRNNTAVGILQLDNRSGIPVRIVGGRLYRDDDGPVIASTSGSIQLEPLKAYVASSGTITQTLTQIHRQTRLIPSMMEP